MASYIKIGGHLNEGAADYYKLANGRGIIISSLGAGINVRMDITQF